ncbi:hypothetical protein TWF718_002700 [Orbilia javanica]|uniref:Uncharacterized protein n=1 Tax=Orbilia javanica TaxID=47235 RepID=A0AAN8MUM7_9PEZI
MGFLFYPPTFLDIVCALPDIIFTAALFLAVLPFWLLYSSALYLLTSASRLIRTDTFDETDLEKDAGHQPKSLDLNPFRPHAQ